MSSSFSFRFSSISKTIDCNLSINLIPLYVLISFAFICFNSLIEKTYDSSYDLSMSSSNYIRTLTIFDSFYGNSFKNEDICCSFTSFKKILHNQSKLLTINNINYQSQKHKSLEMEYFSNFSYY